MPYQTKSDLPDSVRDNLPAHAQDIYGQLAVYLRLKGVTPPRSNRP